MVQPCIICRKVIALVSRGSLTSQAILPEFFLVLCGKQDLHLITFREAPLYYKPLLN